MDLKLYHEPHPEKVIDALNPFTLTFSGITGGAIDKQIFLRNSNSGLYYTNISIRARDTYPTYDRTALNPAGYSWKLSNKSTGLTVEEWEQIQPGNTLSLSQSLGSSGNPDIVTYLPIWVRVSIPRGQRIQTIKEIVFRIQAKEYSI